MPTLLIRVPSITDFYLTAVSQSKIIFESIHGILFEGAQSRHVGRRRDMQSACGTGLGGPVPCVSVQLRA